ncbi:MAG: hypothetical protein WDZ63_13530 [Burkholderiales bacterium]
MESNAQPPIEAEIRRRYAATRTAVPDETAVMVLHVGKGQSAVATGTHARPAAVLTLGIGSRSTSAAHFHHDPPTPLELENAIAAVEDALLPVRDTVSEDCALLTTDAGIRAIALAAGLPDQPEITLTREAIEETFNRLAAVSFGRPAAHEGLPAGGAFAATLLILREFMHHAGFATIAVRA